MNSTQFNSLITIIPHLTTNVISVRDFTLLNTHEYEKNDVTLHIAHGNGDN